MRIGVLTSSRADYSIYLPLLKALKEDTYFDLDIIAFGSHLSPRYGFTVDNIERDGFLVQHRIYTMPDSDTPQAIAQSMGVTFTAFATLWTKEKFDLVFCLGDRYEMFAACASSAPFNIRLAHIHGGEQTLGAIDDAFRNSITHLSSLHFPAAEVYKDRIYELTGRQDHVYNVGALSFDNLKSLELLSIEQFEKQFHINLKIPSILITFHPETIGYERNQSLINELIQALEEIKGYQFIITMPNADTQGEVIRNQFLDFISKHENAFGVESFGTLGYLSCMKHCSFMIGNTSSGFIEASFFPKYVINLGDRQKGRIVTPNIINCPIQKEEIKKSVSNFIETEMQLTVPSVYGDGTTAQKIIQTLKQLQW
jgi:GDP/UDP-N,N'-diacetylbacillosamine 2-epimerase (hydrolysing)